MTNPQSKSTKLDDANNFMRELSEWFDKPKGNLSHKEGWKYYHARLQALIESKVLEGRKAGELYGRSAELVKLSEWGKTIDDQWNEHFKKRLAELEATPERKIS